MAATGVTSVRGQTLLLAETASRWKWRPCTEVPELNDLGSGEP